jgi:hypothetical protein
MENTYSGCQGTVQGFGRIEDSTLNTTSIQRYITRQIISNDAVSFKINGNRKIETKSSNLSAANIGKTFQDIRCAWRQQVVS